MNKTVLSEIELPELVGALAVLPDHIKNVIRAYGNACAATALQSPEIQRALADSKRIDWLADPSNSGNVMLPREVVLQNLHSLRDAIDAAMEVKP